MKKKSTIFIATGGSGGHIYPARAVAKELSKSSNVAIIADKNYKKYQQTNDKYDHYIINCSQIGDNFSKKAFSFFLILLGIFKTLILIILKKPKLIISFGGYATFPTLVSAFLLRKKIIIHEQNSHLGKVNRIFANYAKVIVTSFAETSAILEKNQNKVKILGNPVREKIIKLNKKDYKYPEFFKKYKSKKNLGYNLVLASDFDEVKKIKPEYFNILVIGGSSGAGIFSKILPKAFFNVRDELKNKINITQQCRSDLIDMTFAQYRKYNLNVNLRSFFYDIDKHIAQSHLVICRSGSSTIFEMSMAKKPMILVPLKNAADNHQLKNAKQVEKYGGALVVEEKNFTINNISRIIEELFDNPELLRKMSFDISGFAKDNTVSQFTKIIKNATRY